MEDLTAEQRRYLENESRLCSNDKCKKQNAVTKETCSRCGHVVGAIHKSTGNIMAMSLGLRGFPISLRFESADIFVADNLKSAAPVDLMAIPKGNYIPEWCHLLLNPQEGLSMHQSLTNGLLSVTCTQFLDVLRSYCRDDSAMEVEPLKQKLLLWMAYTSPGSQQHLHLKLQGPCLLPAQQQRVRNGEFMKSSRHYPAEYVRKVLEHELWHPREGGWNPDALQLAQIGEYFSRHGISYDEHFQDSLEAYKNQEDFAFAEADFDGKVENGKVVRNLAATETEMSQPEMSPKEVEERDRQVLGNYGQPKQEDALFLRFLANPTSPDEIVDWSHGLFSQSRKQTPRIESLTPLEEKRFVLA